MERLYHKAHRHGAPISFRPVGGPAPADSPAGRVEPPLAGRVELAPAGKVEPPLAGRVELAPAGSVELAPQGGVEPPARRVEPARVSKGESPPAVSVRLPDDALMVLLARDDPNAFAVLYERHVPAALALATQMCRRRAIAEEVVQEAFLSFWRSRRHFDRTRGNVRGWVLGIVRNRAIDVLRQGVAHDLADPSREVEDVVEARERTDYEVGQREAARELLAALGGLPPEQSRVITLAYYGGYTHTEIASMLDTPIGTVKGRMRLGLRKMAGATADLR